MDVSSGLLLLRHVSQINAVHRHDACPQMGERCPGYAVIASVLTECAIGDGHHATHGTVGTVELQRAPGVPVEERPFRQISVVRRLHLIREMGSVSLLVSDVEEEAVRRLPL